MRRPIHLLPSLIIAGLIAVGALGTHRVTLALSPDQQEAVDSAREALGSGDNPWYDVERDSLRRVEVKRIERYEGFSLAWLKWAVYALLALAIAAIVYFLVRFALEQRKSLKRGADEDAQPLVDEAEALPFLAERPRGDLLGLARHHYEQGNYSEAIIYLFSYELVELDKGSRIHLAKGKTNRQYLRELKDAAPLRGALERTLHAFEGVFFGQRNLDRASFEACWHELPQFQAQVRGAT